MSGTGEIFVFLFSFFSFVANSLLSLFRSFFLQVGEHCSHGESSQGQAVFHSVQGHWRGGGKVFDKEVLFFPFFSLLPSFFSLTFSSCCFFNRRKTATGKSVTISRVPFSYFCQASLCMPFHSEVKRSGSTYKVNFLLLLNFFFRFVSFCVVTFVGFFHDD